MVDICGHEFPPDRELDPFLDPVEYECQRKTWRDHKKCIWHAEVDEKPFEDLQNHRADGRESLDDVYLRGVSFEDGFSFENCTLVGADFTGANLSEVNLSGVNAVSASFNGATLEKTDLSGAHLASAKFNNSENDRVRAWGTDFSNANLRVAEFHGADIRGADFTSAAARGVEFHDLHRGTQLDFQGADLIQAEFFGSILLFPDFTNAEVNSTKFTDRSLARPAELCNPTFEGTDLRDAKFIGVQLENPTFRNLVLNEGTDFGVRLEREATADITDGGGENTLPVQRAYGCLPRSEWSDTEGRDDVEHSLPSPNRGPYFDLWTRPTNPIAAVKRFITRLRADESQSLRSAARTYRNIYSLCKQYPDFDGEKHYYLRRQEATRKSALANNEYRRWGFLSISRLIFGHGESAVRVFLWGILTILFSAIVYPLFAVQSENQYHQLNLQQPLDSFAANIVPFSESLFFSVSVFTSLGYDGFELQGAAQPLVGFEAIAGLILSALFVFVLGRKATR